MNTKVKILSSLELRKIKVIENNDDLVDLRENCPEILFEIAEYVKKNGGEKAYFQASWARKEVSQRLKKAQALLPLGFKLVIDSAYRSPSVQQKSYDAIYKKLTIKYPEWGIKKIEKEMDNRVSPVDIAPHCTGGAIDLTIKDSSNLTLNMGTKLDEYNKKTFTESNEISKEERKNRNILIEVMTKSGFANFPAEWWHWSYGDREWAYQNKTFAIYDSKEI